MLSEVGGVGRVYYIHFDHITGDTSQETLRPPLSPQDSDASVPPGTPPPSNITHPPLGQKSTMSTTSGQLSDQVSKRQRFASESTPSTEQPQAEPQSLQDVHAIIDGLRRHMVKSADTARMMELNNNMHARDQKQITSLQELLAKAKTASEESDGRAAAQVSSLESQLAGLQAQLAVLQAEKQQLLTANASADSDSTRKLKELQAQLKDSTEANARLVLQLTAAEANLGRAQADNTTAATSLEEQCKLTAQAQSLADDQVKKVTQKIAQAEAERSEAVNRLSGAQQDLSIANGSVFTHSQDSITSKTLANQLGVSVANLKRQLVEAAEKLRNAEQQLADEVCSRNSQCRQLKEAGKRELDELHSILLPAAIAGHEGVISLLTELRRPMHFKNFVTLVQTLPAAMISPQFSDLLTEFVSKKATLEELEDHVRTERAKLPILKGQELPKDSLATLVETFVLKECVAKERERRNG